MPHTGMKRDHTVLPTQYGYIRKVPSQCFYLPQNQTNGRICTMNEMAATVFTRPAILRVKHRTPDLQEHVSEPDDALG
eukprot:scaffold60440_cov49-Attheya_sp.AAC.1